MLFIRDIFFFSLDSSVPFKILQIEAGFRKLEYDLSHFDNGA